MGTLALLVKVKVAPTVKLFCKFCGCYGLRIFRLVQEVARYKGWA